MENEKEIQEKMMMYKTLESRLEVLNKQRDLVNTKIMEIISTISSIDEFDKTQKNILFKLGSDAFVQADVVKKNEILVEIGAGIIMEKTLEEGKAILNMRKQEMENVMKEIQYNMAQIMDTVNKLAPEINSMIQKAQGGVLPDG